MKKLLLLSSALLALTASAEKNSVVYKGDAPLSFDYRQCEIDVIYIRQDTLVKNESKEIDLNFNNSLSFEFQNNMSMKIDVLDENGKVVYSSVAYRKKGEVEYKELVSKPAKVYYKIRPVYITENVVFTEDSIYGIFDNVLADNYPEEFPALTAKYAVENNPYVYYNNSLDDYAFWFFKETEPDVFDTDSTWGFSHKGPVETRFAESPFSMLSQNYGVSLVIKDGGITRDYTYVINSSNASDLSNVFSNLDLVELKDIEDMYAKSAGVEGLKNSADNVVYPNPANGVFTVKANGNATLTVTNLSGDVVLQQQFINELVIGQPLAQGVYIVKVSSENGTKTQKLVVK